MDDAQGEKLSETRARDLLSLLVKANVNSSPSERMSDTEVLAQIPTFLAAGHETTSTFLGWTLFELAAHPELQAKLRAECLANPIPAMAEGNHPLTSEQLMTLDKLPLLDAVVREGFRLHAPSPGTVRQAVADDAIPLGKPYVARDGSIQESIPCVLQSIEMN
jgi:cytochrome P450